MTENPGFSNPALDGNVQAALARRGLGSAGGQGALTQTSPGAAMANPTPAPMNPSDMTQASAPSGTPAPTAPALPKFEPQDRTDLITVALIEQMKNDNKLVKEQTKMAAAPAPAPSPSQPAPTMPPSQNMPPMGGGGVWSTGSTWNQPMPKNAMQGNYQSGLGKDYSGMNNYGKGGSF